MAVLWNPWEVLISRLAQMDSSRREILLAGVALGLLFFVGTIGYTLLEGWTIMDGFYMTFNPSPSERISAGDILIVLGETDVITTLREKVCTP